MLKVFLVEDEIIVREGIKNNINWGEYGLHFCGEASDGELAYPLIQKAKPDIVITDIRMPFMDGLELSRLIKKEMPWIKIIILSGYGEFEYAKEAINIGITEYLLKPNSSTELIKCIKKVRDDIWREQEEKENYEKYKRDMKELEEDEKRRLFYDMVSEGHTLAGLFKRGNELNLELSALAYNIVLFKINSSKHSIREEALITEAWQELDSILEGKADVIKFDCHLEGVALLIKGNSEEELLKIQSFYINRIIQVMFKSPDLSYFGGIGMPVKRLGELPTSFHEASRAFAYRYIMEVSDIINYTSLGDDNIATTKSQDLDIGNVMHLDKKKVEAFLKSGNIEEVNYFVEEYLKSIVNENRNSMIFRQYMVMDMYLIVAGFAEELGFSSKEIEQPFQDKSKINLLLSSFELTKSYTERIFNQVIKLRDEIASRHCNDIVNKAKDFIHENYQNDQLSLAVVATNVFISPNHLSALFSQKTGQTFVKYLTDLRMSKAKELLKCTDMRSSEIGFSVGYKDPHYFSYLFKKLHNCSPRQYRYSQSKNMICD